MVIHRALFLKPLMSSLSLPILGLGSLDGVRAAGAEDW